MIHSVHSVTSSSSTTTPLLPLLLLVLVGKLDPQGFIDSVQLQLSIKSIDGILGHIPLAKLDEGTSILGCILVMLLLDDIYA